MNHPCPGMRCGICERKKNALLRVWDAITNIDSHTPEQSQSDYPAWCCHDCAIAAGGEMHPNHMATYHEGRCDVCKEVKVVTEPRDYRYPKFKSKPAS